MNHPVILLRSPRMLMFARRPRPIFRILIRQTLLECDQCEFQTVSLGLSTSYRSFAVATHFRYRNIVEVVGCQILC